ncbi:MAG: hypothetical protein I3J03_08430, partial [Actinomyces succiniciruminis]|nr:hypothetical protein [Actinomyces succiniciruminis]
GAGVREGVLGLVLAGALTTGGVVAVVLLSRAVLTIADLAMGGVGILAARNALNPTDRTTTRVKNDN